MEYNTNNANPESRLIDNNIFFIVPSWGALLGYPTLGKYANQNVSKISQDIVIFFGGKESAVKTEKGVLYFLFGLGYYYIKFELQSGRYITDSRQITGLIFSDFVYDHLATSKNITLEDDRDVIVGEKLFKLPFDLSFKSENKITFIKGTLMRNLFIPYKDIFLELMENLHNTESFQLEKSKHMLLSTHWNFYNKILVSREMHDDLKTYYLNPTAGLDGIILGADEILNHYFSSSDIQIINSKIYKLKSIFSTIEYDPMYLYSIIDNAAKFIRMEGKTTFKQIDKPISISTSKKSILFSAEDNIERLTEWPRNFKRQTKEQLEKSVIDQKESLYKPEEREKVQIPRFVRKEEKFEIRTMRRPIIQHKTLPNFPTSNVIDILLFLRRIVQESYDLNSIGKAFEISRDYIKSMVLHSNYLWDMSKYANIYQREEPNLGLSYKEQTELLEEIDKWIELSRKREK